MPTRDAKPSLRWGTSAPNVTAMPTNDPAAELLDLVDSLPENNGGPHWLGPVSDDEMRGGITWSMLSRYLTCRERFRIQYVEGLSVVEKFNARMEYGNMWHVCEEASQVYPYSEKGYVPWMSNLTEYAQGLCRKYPLQQQEIEHWYGLCKIQFPIYLDHWRKNPDVKGRKVLMPETVFSVPYKLPSGRTVYLRGKRDSVDLIQVHTDPDGRKWPTGIWLQENKTKSQIDAGEIGTQLSFDGQTMLYATALKEEIRQDEDTNRGVTNAVANQLRILPFLGVRYNVVRRSAHKSPESFTKKITEDRSSGRIGEWFARWKVGINQEDIKRFKTECLDPLLENLADDYEWWTWCQKPYEFPHPRVLRSYLRDATKCPNAFNGGQRQRIFVDHTPRHFRMPYGVYNPLLEGAGTALDSYLRTGSKVGLVRNHPLFPELR